MKTNPHAYACLDSGRCHHTLVTLADDSAGIGCDSFGDMGGRWSAGPVEPVDVCLPLAGNKPRAFRLSIGRPSRAPSQDWRATVSVTHRPRRQEGSHEHRFRFPGRVRQVRPRLPGRRQDRAFVYGTRRTRTGSR